jgi:hypothetical protein
MERIGMSGNNRELYWALLAIILITILYLFVIAATGAIPAAQGLFGHSIGILGYILMLMTETLYTLRKRQRSGSWGKMENWLQFHIFTGLVGPYLVLLHTSWKFNGLAGLLAVFTLIIVASGFVGRYIYTMVPRTLDGVEVEADELIRRIKQVEEQLRSFSESGQGTNRVLQTQLSASTIPPVTGSEPSLAPSNNHWQSRRDWEDEKKRLGPGAHQQIKQLEKLLKQHSTLQRQVNSLAKMRQLLALWHTIHVPLGVVLFAMAFVHIIAAIYYATLLR